CQWRHPGAQPRRHLPLPRPRRQRRVQHQLQPGHPVQPRPGAPRRGRRRQRHPDSHRHAGLRRDDQPRGVHGHQTGPAVQTVAFAAVETLNASAGTATLTVLGTSGPDAFTVTPTGANAATIQVTGPFPVINTTNAATLTIDPAGGADTVTVL